MLLGINSPQSEQYGLSVLFPQLEQEGYNNQLKIRIQHIKHIKITVLMNSVLYCLRNSHDILIDLSSC